MDNCYDGDYDPEFDDYVRNEVAMRHCSHFAAFDCTFDEEMNQVRSSCFCPDCGVQIDAEVLRREFAPTDDEAMQDAEMAAERAAEDRMYGVRD